MTESMPRTSPCVSLSNETDNSFPVGKMIGPQQIPQKHSKFYLDDCLITIQVEDTLFNVHKSQLLKSEAFQDMFSLGVATSNNNSIKHTVSGEGSESNPIKLSGIRADDFEKLMTVLYTFHHSNNKPTENGSLLLPALHLANMWNFKELRESLIPLTEKTLSDVDKIFYAREFGVNEWLASAHVQLCMRNTPLTKEEAERIGFNSLLIISHLREKARIAYTTAQVQSTGFNHPRVAASIVYTPNISYFQTSIQVWIDSNFERLG
ncbi:hypothetical protein FRC12_003691 [Ceratobasidium sp. 428]|nr:hypothetical protein FRC12_003691 [Ceratobasidium sp. 428]